MKVLLIEDDPGTLEILRLCFELRRPEVTVIVASTGYEGIISLKNNAPDVIILDLGLPDINGLQVIQRIRRSSDVPIIVTSARSEDEFMGKVTEAGANAYISKPFDPNELLKTFDNALENTQAS